MLSIATLVKRTFPLRLDEDSAEEEVEDTVELSPSPEPEVKRREKKSYSRDSVDDSIFSFDGWSKMKNVSYVWRNVVL